MNTNHDLWLLYKTYSSHLIYTLKNNDKVEAVSFECWWCGKWLLGKEGSGTDCCLGTVTCRVHHRARADAGGTYADFRKTSL